MFRKFGVQVALILMSTLGPATSGLSQCNNRITLVPLTAQKAASKARDFVRFSYTLSASDSLLIQSHTETSIGPYDTGFMITRNGKVVRRVSPKRLAGDFNALAVTRACGPEGPIYFITMQYNGDETSPALLFVLVPSADGYAVSTLPTISGGVFEVSRDDPHHLRTWDNLHEGSCNACETHYQITEYEIQDDKPVRTSRYRTRHLYTSGNSIFDDRRRIRFIP